jgi:integrase
MPGSEISTLSINSHPTNSHPASFEEASALRDKLIWRKLETITVEEAIQEWLWTLKEKTRKNYQSGMRRLSDLGFIEYNCTLQSFSLINHEAIVDRIKLIEEWSECSRQARAACYISFTGFLSRRVKGIIRKAVPSREGNSKTFFKVYQKVKTEAMTKLQWEAFLRELELINPRDCLIAKVILQGAKRVSEVLTLHTDQINWNHCEITFRQSKTKTSIVETVITYPGIIMKKLKDFIGNREGLVFVSRNGLQIKLKQLIRTFSKAGKAAEIPFRITPHVLRASAVTYFKLQGIPDSDIMRVTGHASSEMIYAYDKRSRAENASKYLSLV